MILFLNILYAATGQYEFVNFIDGMGDKKVLVNYRTNFYLPQQFVFKVESISSENHHEYGLLSKQGLKYGMIPQNLGRALKKLIIKFKDPSGTLQEVSKEYWAPLNGEWKIEHDKEHQKTHHYLLIKDEVNILKKELIRGFDHKPLMPPNAQPTPTTEEKYFIRMCGIDRILNTQKLKYRIQPEATGNGHPIEYESEKEAETVPITNPEIREGINARCPGRIVFYQVEPPVESVQGEVFFPKVRGNGNPAIFNNYFCVHNGQTYFPYVVEETWANARGGEVKCRFFSCDPAQNARQNPDKWVTVAPFFLWPPAEGTYQKVVVGPGGELWKNLNPYDPFEFELKVPDGVDGVIGNPPSDLPQDDETALLFHKAFTGNAVAQYQIGHLYDNKNLYKQFWWYIRSVQNGNDAAQGILGVINRADTRLVQFNKFAENPDGANAYNVACYYFNDPNYYINGRRFLAYAANKKHPMAMCHLAEQFFIEENFAEAEKWFEKVAAQTTNPDLVQKAKDRLVTIAFDGNDVELNRRRLLEAGFYEKFTPAEQYAFFVKNAGARHSFIYAGRTYIEEGSLFEGIIGWKSELAKSLNVCPRWSRMKNLQISRVFEGESRFFVKILPYLYDTLETVKILSGSLVWNELEVFVQALENCNKLSCLDFRKICPVDSLNLNNVLPKLKSLKTVHYENNYYITPQFQQIMQSLPHVRFIPHTCKGQACVAEDRCTAISPIIPQTTYSSYPGVAIGCVIM